MGDRMRFTGWGAAFTEVERLMAERAAARESRDYATADALRKQIESIRVGWYGVEIEDTPQGSLWRWEVKDKHPSPIYGGTGQRSDST